MARFLQFISRTILLVAGFGAFSAPLKIGIYTLTSIDATTVFWTSTSILLPVKALSGISPASRRPPRIRPSRQSPNVPSDEASYDSNSSDSTADNLKTNRVENESLRHNKHEQALRDPSLLTGIRFSDRDDLHPYTKQALIEGFCLQTMTRVQASTYDAVREGTSVLARSKTGSGKTLAFLIPTLERLLDSDFGYIPGRSVGCVVLAPTRELAIQIADQAELLVSYHNMHRQGQNELRVACIYGGVKMQRDIRQITGDRIGGGMGVLPTILVATPSRLLEHLEGNSPLNKNFRSNGPNHIQLRKNKSKFANVLAETKIVVLDETDRLLQKSNQRETQKILGFLARPGKRQTLLFSATFPRAVRRFLSNSSIMSKKKKQDTDEDDYRDFLEVDCISNNEGINSRDSGVISTLGLDSADDDRSINMKKSSKSANQKRVEELFVGLENMSQYIPCLLTILRREQQRDNQNYKILVFFPAGRLVRFLFQFFTIGGLESKDNLWEIHSRMSQSSRTRASNAFRNARKGILFSSDVSARGIDYPDVSLVIQLGAPSNDQDYIHRIGRTGRAGKVGKGILVLLPFEKIERNARNRNPQRPSSMRSSLVSYRNDVNLQEDRQLASWLNESEESESLYQRCKDDLEDIRLKVRSGHVVLTPGAQASYKTFLAHYIAATRSAYSNRSSNGKGKSTSEIFTHAQDFVRGIGLAYAPALDDDLASKLGLPKQINAKKDR